MLGFIILSHEYLLYTTFTTFAYINSLDNAISNPSTKVVGLVINSWVIGFTTKTLDAIFSKSQISYY